MRILITTELDDSLLPRTRPTGVGAAAARVHNRRPKNCQGHDRPLKLMNAMNEEAAPNPTSEPNPPRVRPDGRPWVTITMAQAGELKRQRYELRMRTLEEAPGQRVKLEDLDAAFRAYQRQIAEEFYRLDPQAAAARVATVAEESRQATQGAWEAMRAGREPTSAELIADASEMTRVYQEEALNNSSD